ncbi:putative glycine dehydrogenase (decarboxylating) subunit 2 [Planctomycetales bacterium]|nr:putative glycine dehydrogenase (decarboxylating) subunit 2 [Planctomycetales bacterium]GHS97244.1 putative glycine dehydrogenase (decarboxylating) subunit 2 [Planctomycetales bacterium]GHT05714.1 putative glycine dehydrogenase (decarboxylating) subunit 2 [Planctomycetales bacterium]
MKLIYEKGGAGRRTFQLPACDVPQQPLAELCPGLIRAQPAALPEVAEVEAVRHFTALSRRNSSVDNNFYPLGSCTMKYNPKINEKIAAREGFADVHPYVEFFRAQGTMKLLYRLERYLAEICGMHSFTLAPLAGAHGEFVGMRMARAYHESRGDRERVEVLIPDAAHGTNPASATLAGFQTVPVKSGADGLIDLDDLRAKCGARTAAIMLTNPNTLGLFETEIATIAGIVHDAGGLLYYDGANLNAIAGVCRPGDMGFDLMHLNLHKTFATPHGGGGPGAGPVGVGEKLDPFLPTPRLAPSDLAMPEIELVWKNDYPQSIGRVATFYGNIGVCVKAYCYLRTLGADGLREMAENAVLAANYLRVKLRDKFTVPFDRPCMHEFVATPTAEMLARGVHTLDLAKGLIDAGIHPPTIYFPLIVPEALMVEPTETETLETLDEFVAVMNRLADTALTAPEELHRAPITTPVGRLDQTAAARRPKLTA